MIDPAQVYAATAVLAAASLATRLAGPLLMARVAVTPRVQRFLDGMASAVLAALAATAVARGGPREAAAVAAAAVVMLGARNASLAVLCGAGVAAGWTALRG